MVHAEHPDGTVEHGPDDIPGVAMEDWAMPGWAPSIPDRLLEHPRTLLTPHLGSAVDGVRRQMSLQAARQVRQVLSGERPANAVNQPDL